MRKGSFYFLNLTNSHNISPIELLAVNLKNSGF